MSTADFIFNDNVNCCEIKKKNNYCCGTPEVVDCFKKEIIKQDKLNHFILLLKTLWRHKQFIFNVLKARNMARSYYNSRKNYCITFNMNEITCGSGKLILYLNYPDCNSPELLKNPNYNKTTYLMRVVNLLPVVWGCTTKSGIPNSSCSKSMLSCSSQLSISSLEPNERILRDFITNSDFFAQIFEALELSVSSFNAGKFYCKVFTVPGFLSNCKSYKVKLTGEQLRMLQCLLLRGAPNVHTSSKIIYHNQDIANKLNNKDCECDDQNSNIAGTLV